MFDAIRKDLPYNESQRCAYAAMTGILGRMAAETGQEITWDDALASNLELAPGLDQMTMQSEPPVKPDANGNYPVAMPGVDDRLLSKWVTGRPIGMRPSPAVSHPASAGISRRRCSFAAVRYGYTGRWCISKRVQSWPGYADCCCSSARSLPGVSPIVFPLVTRPRTRPIRRWSRVRRSVWRRTLRPKKLTRLGVSILCPAAKPNGARS